jgi:hypothetical protein
MWISLTVLEANMIRALGAGGTARRELPSVTRWVRLLSMLTWFGAPTRGGAIAVGNGISTYVALKSMRRANFLGFDREARRA